MRMGKPKISRLGHDSFDVIFMSTNIKLKCLSDFETGLLTLTFGDYLCYDALISLRAGNFDTTRQHDTKLAGLALP
jgi:hypothetical protein